MQGVNIFFMNVLLNQLNFELKNLFSSILNHD